MIAYVRFAPRRFVWRISRNFSSSQPDSVNANRSFMGLYEQITSEFKEGNLEKCVSLSEEAIQFAKQSEDVNWKDVAAVQLNMSHMLKLLSRSDDAKVVAKRALGTLDAHFSSCKPEVCHALDVVAELCVESGDLTEALSLTDRAIELKTRLFGLHCPQLAKTFNIRGALFLNQDNVAASRTEFLRALGVHVRALGSDRPFPIPIGITLSNIAGLMRRDTQKLEDCVSLYRAVVESFSNANSNGNDMWMEGNALCDLSESFIDVGSDANIQEARECLTRALHIFLTTRGIDHPSTARATVLLQRTRTAGQNTVIAASNTGEEIVKNVINDLLEEAKILVPPKSSETRVSGDVLFLDRRGHVGHGHPHSPLF